MAEMECEEGLPGLNAVVIGATGATGRCLVGSLLKSKDKVIKVTVLSRRLVDYLAEGYEVDLEEEEINGRFAQMIIEDLDDISDEDMKEMCIGVDVFFNCLGTTVKDAGTAEDFVHIDFEIPSRLIHLAKEAGVSHCSTVTSVGANSQSWFLYTRTKGNMEDSVIGEEFGYTSIFRPGFLNRGKGNKRLPERLIGWLLPGMPVAMVAEAMLQDAWIYYSNSDDNQLDMAETVVACYNSAAIIRLYEESSERIENLKALADNIEEKGRTADNKTSFSQSNPTPDIAQPRISGVKAPHRMSVVQPPAHRMSVVQPCAPQREQESTENTSMDGSEESHQLNVAVQPVFTKNRSLSPLQPKRETAESFMRRLSDLKPKPVFKGSGPLLLEELDIDSFEDDDVDISQRKGRTKGHKMLKPVKGLRIGKPLLTPLNKTPVYPRTLSEDELNDFDL